MLENLLLLAHVVAAVFMVIVILVQRSDGGMGALGGGGSSALMSGASAGNALTRLTTILAVIFMGSSLLLSLQTVGDARPTSVVDVKVEERVDVPAVPAPLSATPEEKTDTPTGQ